MEYIRLFSGTSTRICEGKNRLVECDSKSEQNCPHNFVFDRKNETNILKNEKNMFGLSEIMYLRDRARQRRSLRCVNEFTKFPNCQNVVMIIIFHYL